MLDNKTQSKDVFCKHITDKIIKNDMGTFDELYSTYVFNFIVIIYDHLCKVTKDDTVNINIERFLVSAGDSFKMTMINLCKKLLIGELYKNKESLLGDTPEERYKHFVNVYMIDKMPCLFEEGSVIDKLIKLNTTNKSNVIIEFIDRYINDLRAIEERFNKKINMLEDISISCGDTHNGGRSVFIVTVDSGYKLVYKPHSLKNDWIFKKLVELLNSKKELKLTLDCAETLNCGSYGWQKFVNFSECNSYEQVENYMYRFGTLICVTYLLKTTDIHFENIIACGEFPLIVDLETLIFNDSFFRSKDIDKLDGIVKAISDSVYTSMLLPQNFEFQKTRIEMSGIAGGYGYNDEYVTNTVTNPGTDNIQFDTVSVNINETQNLMNIVKVNGEKIRIADFSEDIINGFSDCYKMLIKYRSEMQNYIEVISNFDGCFRQVLRPTALYFKYLQTSYHPYYMETEEIRSKVFQCLNNKNVSSIQQKELIEMEIKQLEEDDVPYFYTKYDSKDLFMCNGDTITNFYEVTLKSALLNKINKLSENDLQRQIFFIKSSISGSNNSDKEIISNPKKIDILKDIPFNNDLIKNADVISRFIGSYIDNYYSMTHKENGYRGFYNIIDNDGGFELGAVKPILYDGAGIVLFYMYLFNMYKEEKYYDICKELLYTLNNHDIELFEGKIGVFDGICSLLYVNYNAYIVLKDLSYYEKYKELTSYLLKVDMSENMDLDVMSGLSGIIIMALNIYKCEEKEVDILALAEKCGEILLEKYSSETVQSKTGFSHGLAGIACAFIMLSHFSKKYNYYTAGIELLKKENVHYKPDYNNWIDLRKVKETPSVYWCYGAPGIGISRNLILDYVKQEDREFLELDIKNCINKILSNGLETELSNCLCHGNIGNLDVLLTIAISNKDQNMIELLHEKTQLILKDLIDNGMKFTNPVKAANIDFMTGLSGMGYFLLRLLSNKIPSILSLESVKKSDF